VNFHKLFKLFSEKSLYSVYCDGNIATIYYLVNGGFQKNSRS